jgi:hypothetical protein
MITENQDYISLLVYLLILIIFIASQFLFVRILEIYEMGVIILVFVMIANFVIIIVPVYMIYQTVITVYNLRKITLPKEVPGS